MMAAFLLAAGTTVATAQSFLGRGTPQTMVIPGGQPDAPPPPRSTTAAAPADAALPQRPMPAIASRLRLSGEESELRWSTYLTEAQARERLRFRVGYLAAISVVPDLSSLTVTVNDVVIGRRAIRAPGAVRITEFDIPADVLKPGFNAVTISAVQRHRVDCSLQATYELWTQIDPSWTGFVMPPGVTGAQSLRDLQAIAPDVRGTVPIRIVLPNRPAFAVFERLIGLVQRIALAGRFGHVVVEFGPAQPGPAGLNILVEPKDDPNASGELGASPARQAPPLAFLPMTPDRAATLVLRGMTAVDIEAATAHLGAIGATELIGSPQGLQSLALASGVPIRGGETLTLEQLGLRNREFSGRLFRTMFDVAMPPDMIAADYTKVSLRLAGFYAAGLQQPGAQIIVDVNGRNVASIPLPRTDGEDLREAQIALPLGRWRPGRNQVEIRALLPTDGDRECREGDGGRKRLLLLAGSTLTVPPLARAARLPELAALAAGAMPYLSGETRPRLVVPAPDGATMGAAATIAVKMAMVAGRPIDFELANERALERRTPTIVVAAARTLDPDALRSVSLNPDQIQSIWQNRAAVTPPAANDAMLRLAAGAEGFSVDRLRNNMAPACILPGVAQSAVDPQRRPATLADQTRELTSAWNTSLGSRNSIGENLSAASAAIAGGASRLWRVTSTWVADHFRDREVEVPARASLIVGQSVVNNTFGSVLTVFTAASPSILQSSVTCLTTPFIWNRLQGSTAVLDANGGSLQAYDAGRTQVVETLPRSLANLRLVLAGWFSTNSAAFVLTLLAAAIALGLSTAAMLRSIGRRPGGGNRTSRHEVDP